MWFPVFFVQIAVSQQQSWNGTRTWTSYHAIHTSPMDSISYGIQQRRKGFKRRLTQIIKAVSVRYYQTWWSSYNKWPRNSLDTWFPEAEGLLCICIYLLLHTYTYVCVYVWRIYFIFYPHYICLTYYFHSHPWSLLRLDVLNGPFILMLHRAQMSPGKWSVQRQFCGSLSRLQISVPPFFLLTYLHYQGATYLATYMFINICSLQAYSLSSKLCIGVVESTQFLCSLLTSQSLPLCTRMAPRS